MTLKNHLILALATCSLLSMTAEAYVTPGPRIPGPRDQYDPYPPPPAPGIPVPDHSSGAYGRTESKTAYFYRQVINGRLNLRDLAGIGSYYHGYSVESVEVEIQSDYNTQVSLLLDGRLDASAYSPQGRILLRPQYRAVIGQDLTNLLLDIRGRAHIQTVTVHLRQESYGGPGYPGHTIDVPVYLNRHLSGDARLDVGMHLDMNRYRGYRLQSIEVQANASYNVAVMDLQINGFKQGQTLQIDRYGRIHTIRPHNAIIGQTASSIVLATRGDLDVYQVVFKLSPR